MARAPDPWPPPAPKSTQWREHCADCGVAITSSAALRQAGRCYIHYLGAQDTRPVPTPLPSNCEPSTPQLLHRASGTPTWGDRAELPGPPSRWQRLLARIPVCR